MATMRAKRNRGLRRERQEFMARLSRERESRVVLENWAASRIQAAFRGFIVRPRPPRQCYHQPVSPEEMNRRLVADIQAILTEAGLPTIPGVGPDGRRLTSLSGRAGTMGITRPRSRKQRMLLHQKATQISRIVRGFLERRRGKHRWKEWKHKKQCSAAKMITRAWKGYHKRKGWYDMEIGLRREAAAKIQARYRGMASRLALARAKKQK
ncbi:unnamed protein product, partial [Discosporangium mesarthrocarpum]